MVLCKLRTTNFFLRSSNDGVTPHVRRKIFFWQSLIFAWVWISYPKRRAKFQNACRNMEAKSCLAANFSNEKKDRAGRKENAYASALEDAVARPASAAKIISKKPARSNRPSTKTQKASSAMTPWYNTVASVRPAADVEGDSAFVSSSPVRRGIPHAFFSSLAGDAP